MTEISTVQRAREYGVAHGTRLLSKLCVAFPNAVGSRIVGDYPTEWEIAKEVGGGNWQTVDGDPNSGWLPVNYASSAVFAAPQGSIRDLAERFDAKPAAGYRVGRFVLVTELTERPDPSQYPDAAMEPAPMPEALPYDLFWERQGVIFGVGQEAITASVGVYRKEDGLYVPAHTQVVAPMPGVTAAQAAQALTTVPVV